MGRHQDAVARSSDAVAQISEKLKRMEEERVAEREHYENKLEKAGEETLAVRREKDALDSRLKEVLEGMEGADAMALEIEAMTGELQGQLDQERSKMATLVSSIKSINDDSLEKIKSMGMAAAAAAD